MATSNSSQTWVSRPDHTTNRLFCLLSRLNKREREPKKMALYTLLCRSTECHADFSKHSTTCSLEDNRWCTFEQTPWLMDQSRQCDADAALAISIPECNPRGPTSEFSEAQNLEALERSCWTPVQPIRIKGEDISTHFSFHFRLSGQLRLVRYSRTKTLGQSFARGVVQFLSVSLIEHIEGQSLNYSKSTPSRWIDLNLKLYFVFKKNPQHQSEPQSHRESSSLFLSIS